MFPSDAGTLRTPNSLDRPLAKCLEAAGVKHHFTVHGIRYTFTDLIRLSNADAVVRRALTGHVTQEMQQHYSHVGTEEKRAVIAGADPLGIRLHGGRSGPKKSVRRSPGR
jgi:integrase